MKLRGESGAMPARSSGGIIGKGGKSVASVYKESIPPASIKIRPGNADGGAGRKSLNTNATEIAALRKSGVLAKKAAAQVDAGKPSRTIKINSK
jgi:hypothetical protein